MSWTSACPDSPCCREQTQRSPPCQVEVSCPPSTLYKPSLELRSAVTGASQLAPEPARGLVLGEALSQSLCGQAGMEEQVAWRPALSTNLPALQGNRRRHTNTSA